MGLYQLHKYEWGLSLVTLIILFTFRIEKALKDRRTRVENLDELDYFKNAHQVEMVTEWITSQYCKPDLEILCPKRLPVASRCAAFDPPLRFVLDLPDTYAGEDCSIRELLDHFKWTGRADAKDLEEEEILTLFMAHILDKVRTKSSAYFRAEDRSIQEFEQSRLIESSLASMLHLFTAPTNVNKQGQIISTAATEYGMTERVWTREEFTSLMHESVLYLVQHKHHGAHTTGTALRLSRQQPSFLFKFLPLVKEQIQNLELDSTLESTYRQLYPFQKLNLEPILDSDCLLSHYKEGSLISQDCMLALETAPLKLRDLDWEGSFSLVLVHIYTFLSGVFVLCILSRVRKRQEDRWSNGYDRHDEMDTKAVSTGSLNALSNRSMKPASSRSLQSTAGTKSKVEPRDRNSNYIRRVKWLFLAYLGASILLALFSSFTSQTILFSDFLDGMGLVVMGFLSLLPMSLKKGHIKRLVL